MDLAKLNNSNQSSQYSIAAITICKVHYSIIQNKDLAIYVSGAFRITMGIMDGFANINFHSVEMYNLICLYK
jgi:hypothetical protein